MAKLVDWIFGKASDEEEAARDVYVNLSAAGFGQAAQALETIAAKLAAAMPEMRLRDVDAIAWRGLSPNWFRRVAAFEMLSAQALTNDQSVDVQVYRDELQHAMVITIDRHDITRGAGLALSRVVTDELVDGCVAPAALMQSVLRSIAHEFATGERLENYEVIRADTQTTSGGGGGGSVAMTRTTVIDDDGSGTNGTILDPETIRAQRGIALWPEEEGLIRQMKGRPVAQQKPRAKAGQRRIDLED